MFWFIGPFSKSKYVNLFFFSSAVLFKACPSGILINPLTSIPVHHLLVEGGYTKDRVTCASSSDSVGGGFRGVACNSETKKNQALSCTKVSLLGPWLKALLVLIVVLSQHLFSWSDVSVVNTSFEVLAFFLFVIVKLFLFCFRCVIVAGSEEKAAVAVVVYSLLGFGRCGVGWTFLTDVLKMNIKMTVWQLM